MLRPGGAPDDRVAADRTRPPVSAWLTRYQRRIQVAGAILLIVVGLLLLTGGWDYLTRWLQTQLISDVEVLL